MLRFFAIEEDHEDLSKCQVFLPEYTLRQLTLTKELFLSSSRRDI